MSRVREAVVEQKKAVIIRNRWYADHRIVVHFVLNIFRQAIQTDSAVRRSSLRVYAVHFKQIVCSLLLNLVILAECITPMLGSACTKDLS